MTENHTPEEPYSMEDMQNQIQDPRVIENIIHGGTQAILALLAGPDHWETMPPLAMETETAREASRIVRGCPEAFDNKSWLDTQRVVVHITIRGLFAEFEEWCRENDRHDLLASAKDLMNAALPPEERVL